MPDDLDWDGWQGPAPKKAFKQGYLGFRGWWEYGSGLVGDWGAHHVDVANWFMNADAKAPLRRPRSAVSARSRTSIPSVSSTRSRSRGSTTTSLMTFANSAANPANAGHRGLGRLLRRQPARCRSTGMGWALRPPVAPTRNRVGPEPPPGAGNVQLGTAPAAGGPPGRTGRRARRWTRRTRRTRRPGCVRRRRRWQAHRSRPSTSTRAAPSRRTIRSTRTRATSSTAQGEEPEDERADGDRLQLRAAVPARARSDAAEPRPRLGRGSEEEQSAVKQLPVASLQFQ